MDVTAQPETARSGLFLRWSMTTLLTVSFGPGARWGNGALSDEWWVLGDIASRALGN